MNNEDPYRGLPSLTRLESDLETSERHLARGWASRHMRVIGGAGVALVLGLGFSPVGPAFGGDDTPGSDVVKTLEAKLADAPSVQMGYPAGDDSYDMSEGFVPTVGKGDENAVETIPTDEIEELSKTLDESDAAGVRTRHAAKLVPMKFGVRVAGDKFDRSAVEPAAHKLMRTKLADKIVGDRFGVVSAKPRGGTG